MTIKIAVDAGHGINTPGKRSPADEREWSFNDALLRAFCIEMAQYGGVIVKRFDDPTGKTDIPLKTRTDGANVWGADIYISFHHNANTAKWGDWTGVEIFVAPNASVKSVALANAVLPALVEGYGLKNRGVKRKDLHIVRETKMPAILIEGGFMDSRIDIIKLRDKSVLANSGKLIAQATAKHLELKRKQTVAPTPSKPSNEPFNLTQEQRKTARDIIKYAVKTKAFSSAHADVDSYTDAQLVKYSLIFAKSKTK